MYYLILNAFNLDLILDQDTFALRDGRYTILYDFSTILFHTYTALSNDLRPLYFE